MKKNVKNSKDKIIDEQLMIEAFLNVLRKIFKEDDEFSYLDIGGGAGIISVEIAEKFPNAHGVVYDKDEESTMYTDEFIEENDLVDRVEHATGDFLNDNIGEGYDLVIASGIYHFEKKNLEKLGSQISKALDYGGYFGTITAFSEDERNEQKGRIMKWIEELVNKSEDLASENEIEEALGRYGFEKMTSDGDCGAISVYKNNKKER